MDLIPKSGVKYTIFMEVNDKWINRFYDLQRL